MFHISFDFDADLRQVSNLQVEEIEVKYNDDSIPTIEVQDNKLVFSEAAIKMLDLTYGDRIAINYIQKNNEITFPVIAKADTFVDKNAGNKLLTNNTVSFKGIQRTILAKYGTLFKLEEFKDAMFKLVNINEADYIEQDAELADDIDDLNLI